MSRFKIVLFEPLIPGNTGSIGRTCVGLDLELCLIKPLGFDLSEKEVRRAGLDYWKYVQIKTFENWEDFLEKENPPASDLFFLSKFAKKTYYQAPYHKDCYLVFGSEVKGLPQKIHEAYPDQFYGLPMYSEHIRSLNLSNVATAVAYEALRKIEFSPHS